MKTETKDPSDIAMENLAILDLLVREGWSESVVDRVERSLAYYAEVIQLRAESKLS